MNNYDTSVSSFKKYMERGLGRTFYILDNSEDINKYKDAILYGCLNNLAYDIQLEGTRAYYVFNLMKYFDDLNYFENRIYEKFDSELDYRTFCHLSDLLVLIYKEYNNEEAKNLLEKKYRSLLNKKSFDSEDFSKLDYICINLKEIKGLRRVKKIIHDIDKIYPQLISIKNLEWFFFNILESYKNLNTFIKDECKNIKVEDIENYFIINDEDRKEDKERLLYADNIIKEIKEKHRYYFPFNFACKANEFEKKKLVKYYFQEQDEDLKRDLLFIMSHGTFPITFEELHQEFHISSHKLKPNILNVIVSLQDSRIKDFGYALLDNEDYFYSGIEMICKYYSKEDYNTLIKYVKKLKITYEDYGWHSAFNAVSDLLSRKRQNLPNELMVYMYENTICSDHREFYVRDLKRLKLLTKQIIEECQYDCNNEIRKYANRISHHE